MLNRSQVLWFLALIYRYPSVSSRVVLNATQPSRHGHHERHGFYTANQDSVFYHLAVKAGTDKVTQTKESQWEGHSYEGLYSKVSK